MLYEVITISARLLAPELPALCRTRSVEVAANMASFGTRHIINPYEKFAEYLAQALHAPNSYHLLTWLTGQPGATVTRHRDPPIGKWVLRGYGDFGRILVEAFDQEEVPVTIRITSYNVCYTKLLRHTRLARAASRHVPVRREREW